MCIESQWQLAGFWLVRAIKHIDIDMNMSDDISVDHLYIAGRQ
jgi:hypothetical protein